MVKPCAALCYRRRPVVLPALLLAFAATGCGGTRTYPVEGKVVWPDGRDAKELAGGWVTFDSSEAKVSARGEIQPDGSFRMETFKAGDGAVPGTHKVVITFPIGDPDRPSPGVIHPRFGDPQRSGLEVTVEPKTNRITLQVERPKRR